MVARDADWIKLSYANQAPGQSVVTLTKVEIPVYFPAPVTWNGIDSVMITPAVSNIAEILASRDSTLNFSWTLTGMAVDSASTPKGLLLRKAQASGSLKVRLCLDNGGPISCRDLEVTVNLAASAYRRRAEPRTDAIHRLWDATGRWHSSREAARGSSHLRVFARERSGFRP